MNNLDYKILVDSTVLKTETKKQVEPVIKDVVEEIDDGELQVKVERLPNAKYLVSIRAFFPHATFILKKEGKRIIPIIKKLKKNLMRLSREKSKKYKRKGRKIKQAHAS